MPREERAFAFLPKLERNSVPCKEAVEKCLSLLLLRSSVRTSSLPKCLQQLLATTLSSTPVEQFSDEHSNRLVICNCEFMCVFHN